MRHLILTACILLFACIGVKAQDASANTAYAGQNAVFVYHAFHPASPQYPDKGITGYRLEREDLAAPGKWVLISDFHTPQNAGEVYDNFSNSFRFFPDGRQLRFKAEDSWAKFIKNNQELDSLKLELAFTPIQMAFSILVADTTVVKGKTYRYRVSQTGAGVTGASFISNPVAFPAVLGAKKPMVLKRMVEPKAIRIEWYAKNDLATFNFKVYRSSNNDKAFTEIRPYISMDIKGDTLKYSIRDEHVAFSTMYHYYITPVNSFGGGGNVISDTVNATCMEAKGLLTPQHFTAQGDTATHAIKLKYQLPDEGFIGSVAVMRSMAYDTGYVQIGVAAPRDSVYTDHRIDAGQKYYYYLVMVDKMGRKGVRSAKTFGLYQSKKNDFPARFVKAVQQGKRVLVTWENPEGEKLSGYYVYRSEGVGMPMARLTVLIPLTAKPGSYIDTFRFKPGVTYGYAVRSENLSNAESKNSNIAYVQPVVKDTVVVAPKNVQASAQNNKIRLTWYDMRPFNPMQAGYRISRKAEGDKQDMVIENNYPADFSTYADSTALPGINYTYSIECLSRGGSSVKSTVSARLPAHSYTAVRGLVAYNTPRGISLTWDKVIDSGIKQFAIYRYKRGSKAALIATVAAGKAAYLDNTAAKGSIYYFYIRSVGAGKSETSANSNEAYVAY